MVLIVLFSFILLSILTDIIIQYVLKKRSESTALISEEKPVFKESSIRIPKGLYFDKSHTWAHMEKNGNVKIGLSDFIQHITGPLTGITLKNKGEHIKRGEEVLKINRTGKQLNIYSPITGTIKQYNTELLSDTSKINSSPYNDGWIYIVEPSKWLNETKFMKMADKAIDWITYEFARLKVFFATYGNTNIPEFSKILQDGGELQDNALAELDPKVWDDFQTNFIDKAN